MANTTNKDISEKVNDLERKVDSIAQRQDEVLIPGIDAIKKQMDNFAYVSQKDYALDEKIKAEKEEAQNTRLDEIEKLVFAGALKKINGVDSNITRIIGATLAIVVIVAVVVALISTIPAVRSAVGNVL